MTACATGPSAPPPEVRPLAALQPSRAAQAMLASNGTPKPVWPLGEPMELRAGEKVTVVHRTCYTDHTVPVQRDGLDGGVRRDVWFDDALSELDCGGSPRAAHQLARRSRKVGHHSAQRLPQVYALEAFAEALDGEDARCVEAAIIAIALGARKALPASAPPAAQACFARAAEADPDSQRPWLAEPVVTRDEHTVRLAFILTDRRPLAREVRVYHRPHRSQLRFSQMEIQLAHRLVTTLFAPMVEVNVMLPVLAQGDTEYYVELRDAWGNRLQELGAPNRPLVAKPE